MIQGRGAADRPLALRDWSAAERVETDLGRRGAVRTRRRLRGASAAPAALFANAGGEGVQGSLTPGRPPTAGALGWRLQGWVTSSNLVNTSASVSANRNTATLANDQYATPALGVGFNAAVRRGDAGYSWELGVDVRDFDGESHELSVQPRASSPGRATGGGGQLVAGVYVEASRSLGGWLLTGGVRLDDWADLRLQADPDRRRRCCDQHPRRIAAEWCRPAGSACAARSRERSICAPPAYAGFRPATLNELHRTFRVGNDVTKANAGLTPERLYGAEAGRRRPGRGCNWDADVFVQPAGRCGDQRHHRQGAGHRSRSPASCRPAARCSSARTPGTVNAWGVEGEADCPAPAGARSARGRSPTPTPGSTAAARRRS